MGSLRRFEEPARPPDRLAFMYLIGFATDYDGTLAHHGRVSAATLAALERLRESGRKLLLVTGRELPDLKRVFDRLDLFDAVVAENGSLLHFPHAGEDRPLAAAPPQALVEALLAKKVQPLSIGQGIIATWEPNEAAALECIRDLGLEWQIIFNKGAVMILPPGVNKATGLAAALEALDLSPLNVLAIGDAENDHAFLSASGCAVAVANALEAVKATADAVTRGDHGAGVAETIDSLLTDESVLASRAAARRRVRLGDDETAMLQVDRGAVLIAGHSGGGKSTLTTAIIEKLAAEGFQVCVLDPEGDYDDMQDAVVLGDAERAPTPAEAIDLLRKPGRTPLVINMLGLSVRDRPALFVDLLSQICDLRGRTARPHWLVIDEAHHMLPADPGPDGARPPRAPSATLYVTVHPSALHPAALADVRTLIVVGPKTDEVVAGFCQAIGRPAPDLPPLEIEEAVLFWNLESPPRWIRADRPRHAHQRHTRKYARGELGEDKSFYFRGPHGALNLRAHNLTLFLQMADGVDDATWLHHLHRGDYARWFREAIKDEALAQDAARLQDGEDPLATRKQMRALVESRYMAP
jgi:hydroxymethylpyrimidine pyrophosphatase-like HAD family hydrolase